jgi:hypothetical protein
VATVTAVQELPMSRDGNSNSDSKSLTCQQQRQEQLYPLLDQHIHSSVDGNNGM